jgi:hypothetical protein
VVVAYKRDERIGVEPVKVPKNIMPKVGRS